MFQKEKKEDIGVKVKGNCVITKGQKDGPTKNSQT